MTRWLLALACVAGCGPEFAVVPSGGVNYVQGQMNGVVMTALADQWGGDPYDLANFVTPIAVELYNGGPNEVRVSFVDFALADEQGHRYAAVSPFVPDALGFLGPCAQRRVGCDDGGGGRLADGKLVLYASRGGGGGGVHVGAPSGMRGGGGGGMRGGGGVRVGAPMGVRRGGGGSWGVSGGGFRGGFQLHGGYRGWYGPGVSYWGGPFWPAYSSPWVVLWGPAYYPRPPSHEVLLSALPEGVLPPGASVTGFLYFQRATSPGVRHLDLAWSIHDARSSADLGSTHVALDVVPR